MASISPEQAAAIAATVSGRVPAAAPPADTIFDKVWHTSAVVILIGGVVGGVVMIVRAVKTGEEAWQWWNPFSWSLGGLLGKI